jgi:hypothetical protein
VGVGGDSKCSWSHTNGFGCSGATRIHYELKWIKAVPLCHAVPTRWVSISDSVTEDNLISL